MLKVIIRNLDDLEDSGKVFFCDLVNVHEAGNYKFCELHNKRAKVKTCQIPLTASQCVIVSEDK